MASVLGKHVMNLNNTSDIGEESDLLKYTNFFSLRVSVKKGQDIPCPLGWHMTKWTENANVCLPFENECGPNHFNLSDAHKRDGKGLVKKNIN